MGFVTQLVTPFICPMNTTPWLEWIDVAKPKRVQALAA